MLWSTGYLTNEGPKSCALMKVGHSESVPEVKVADPVVVVYGAG